MKRILCLLAVMPVFLAGCGHSRVVLDGGGGEYYVTEDEDRLSEKVKPTDDPAETKPPKKKTEDAAVTDNISGETSTEASTQETTVTDGNEPGDADSPDNSVSQPADEDVYKYHLDGFVIQKDSGSILICEEDLCRVSLKCGEKLLGSVQVGDEIKVKYDGVLTEGATQSGTAHSIEVVQKAAKKYQLKRFAYKDLCFTVLMPEDWSDRVIDYPQEGDFTDWGVRIQPSGSAGSLDISWHSAIAIFDPYDKRKITVNGNNATEYSKNGNWKFLEYPDNNFIINNNFDTNEQSKYADDIRRIRATMEFV